MKSEPRTNHRAPESTKAIARLKQVEGRLFDSGAAASYNERRRIKGLAQRESTCMACRRRGSNPPTSTRILAAAPIFPRAALFHPYDET